MFLGHWSWWHQCPHLRMSIWLSHCFIFLHLNIFFVLTSPLSTLWYVMYSGRWKSLIKYFHVFFDHISVFFSLGKWLISKITICIVWFALHVKIWKKSLFQHGWSVACKNIADSKATKSFTSTLLAWVRAHESYITGVLFLACCTSPCGRLFCPSSYNCSHMWDILISVNLVSLLRLLSLANVIYLLSFVTFVYFMSLLSLPHLFSRKYLIQE